jgi:hypothetical protein
VNIALYNLLIPFIRCQLTSFFGDNKFNFFRDFTGLQKYNVWPGRPPTTLLCLAWSCLQFSRMCFCNYSWRGVYLNSLYDSVWELFWWL